MKIKSFFSVVLIVLVSFVLTQEVSAQDVMQDFFSRINDGGAEETGALPDEQGQPRSPEFDLSGEEGAFDPFAPEPPKENIAESQRALQERIRERAFEAAVTGLLPMNPDEIRKLMERYDRTRQAVEVPIYPYPEPEIAATTVSLDPGSVPVTVKVATGHVTTLSLLDITGEPWPVQDATWAGNFEVAEGEEGSNIIRIIPMSDFTHGNMVLRLVELKTPVTFTLKTSRDKVHYRLDARIPELGPMAEAPLIEGGVQLVAGNAAINAILDGVPPQGAERLDVAGVDGRTTAFWYNGKTYVRTPFTLLSPGWESSVSSADGMNVYALAAAPVVLLSNKGQVVRVRLREEGIEQ